MPRPESTQPGIRSRAATPPIAPPNLEPQKMGRPASRSESTATPQPHTRPRPCKHCGASARKRSYASSLWFLFAEFLEAWIIPKRIEHGIEPEQRGSERHSCRQCVSVGYRQEFLQSGNGAVEFSHARR